MEFEFKSFKTASSFSREIATQEGLTVKLTRSPNGNGFLVSIPRGNYSKGDEVKINAISAIFIAISEENPKYTDSQKSIIHEIIKITGHKESRDEIARHLFSLKGDEITSLLDLICKNKISIETKNSITKIEPKSKKNSKPKKIPTDLQKAKSSTKSEATKKSTKVTNTAKNTNTTKATKTSEASKITKTAKAAKAAEQKNSKNKLLKENKKLRHSPTRDTGNLNQREDDTATKIVKGVITAGIIKAIAALMFGA